MNLNLFDTESPIAIHEAKFSFAASWAQGAQGLFWVLLGVVALAVLAIAIYTWLHTRGSMWVRVVLSVLRSGALALLFLMLAEPVLKMTFTSESKPFVYVLLDGTESMAIEDEYSDDEQAALAMATGVDISGDAKPARIDYVKSLLHQEGNVFAEIQDKARTRFFLFDGSTTSQLRPVETEAEDSQSLSTVGRVTAMGSVFNDAQRQVGSGRLAGVVVVSDFSHNSGPAPLGLDANSPAARLNAPIYAVGVGATEVVDLGVAVQTDPKMKKAERTTVTAKITHTGLQGESVEVHVWAVPLDGDSREPVEIGVRQVTLEGPVAVVELPFTPKDSGRFEFFVEATPQAAEAIAENNRASREVNIIDDYLRLMYVAHEPDWEWRFVKEVFHRDKLIGMDGFRTYLASSDPRVRESNILFLPTLTPPRNEFFSKDVIFLGDMPGPNSTTNGAVLSNRFCEMTREYVSKFGGGLVVIAGPKFGPQQLAASPLADMLPVVLDPEATLIDDDEFEPRLTADAEAYSFMQLGAGPQETAKAWNNLGKLPWYQPVKAKHELGVVLAEHPTDKCADGKTPQPIIAIRQFGKGEVVYVAHNEMWRLRRRYGEKYYRTFWSQLIYRLGMSHALGSEKRFVVRTDMQQYKPEDKVNLSIEAYDENFDPLSGEKLDGQSIEATLSTPGNGAAQSIKIPLVRDGLFEAKIPVIEPGDYTVDIKDPVSGETMQKRFRVADVSAERRSAVRNVALQESLATQTGGRSYTLAGVSQLADDLNIEPIVETQTRSLPLWDTRLWFFLLIGLLFTEWLIRKVIRLP